MSCDCGRCRQHYKVLGFAFGAPAESEIHEAYKEGVKQWHPDLYENFASLRAEAEERFKQIQVAYRELKEHNGITEELPVEDVAVSAVETSHSSSTPISFDGASGCLVASQFTTEVEEVIARYQGQGDRALAIVDLAGARSRVAGYGHFLLLTTRGIMVRDARNIVSLLWYKDLGEVNLIERKDGKLSLPQRLLEKVAGSPPNCLLQICRSDGTHFFSLSDPVDDNAKKVIYSFLLSQKPQAQP